MRKNNHLTAPLLILLSATLLIPHVLCCAAAAPAGRSISAFPILMYDSDIGFGLGGKAVVKNLYQKDESMDLTMFGSSKGEQWFAFTFSMPDFEIRQGKPYPLALDIKCEYDKFIKSNFFGIGNDSRDNTFQFTKEFGKVDVTLSRGLTAAWCAEIGFRLTCYSVYGFDPSWGTITAATPGAGQTRVAVAKFRVKWDSRDSYINPNRGWQCGLGYEESRPQLGSSWLFHKLRLELAGYFSPLQRHVLASRLWLQHTIGDVPYLEMGRIGDSWTARGYKADRFLDKGMILAGLEYRYPLYKNIGGVIFADGGRVSPGLLAVFDHWHADWGLGLRYYLANFVVRLDVGYSVEGTRIFFNFGQVF
jgi:outer membrane protein assembly factor BamA